MSTTKSKSFDEYTWNVIDAFFQSNPQVLVEHQLGSYNDFVKNGINQIFHDSTPILINKGLYKIRNNNGKQTTDFKYKCKLYLGGKQKEGQKKGSKLYIGTPVIADAARTHIMYPNEARLRNMTYAFTLHYDVDVELLINDTDDKVANETVSTELTFQKQYLGKIPIMLMSDLCVLKPFPRETRYEMGECRNDPGGYFIIDGQEKTIVCQEIRANNVLFLNDQATEEYSHGAMVRSISDNAAKPPVGRLSVMMVAANPVKLNQRDAMGYDIKNTKAYGNKQMVVLIPNVRRPIPLFTLMRALGVESDEEIIDCCLLDKEKYASLLPLFIPSVHDAGQIFTQRVALEFISQFIKTKDVDHALYILADYFLPHVGELNFREKAYYLGYMVRQLLRLVAGEINATDRDNFQYKRVEVPGTMLANLFKEYFIAQRENIRLRIDSLFYSKGQQGTERQAIPLTQDIFKTLISNNTVLFKEQPHTFFDNLIVADGINKAFKGRWGSKKYTMRVGVVQSVNRLSHNSFIAHLRKLNLTVSNTGTKVPADMRKLHGSQWGIIDPVDTPDGAHAGLHKHLAIAASITPGSAVESVLSWFNKNTYIITLQERTPQELARLCKVFVNGRWIGMVQDPMKVMHDMKEARRLGRVGSIDMFVSIHWNVQENSLVIFTDAGRLCRPVYYLAEDYDVRRAFKNAIKTWNDLVQGENAIIDYMDNAEASAALISMNLLAITPQHTHLEIHPSLMLGVMGHQIIFPENNQLPRDVFACGQAKQGVSMYSTNYQVRMDNTAVVLNYGQVPLVKSRYLKYINHEENPCGENAIVAIMSLNGYNVEDSILINEGALKRGMFSTTYYTTYVSEETIGGALTGAGNDANEADPDLDADADAVANPNTSKKNQYTNVAQIVVNDDIHTYEAHLPSGKTMPLQRVRRSHDYSQLDKNGLVRENTVITPDTVLIGKVRISTDSKSKMLQCEPDITLPKKSQTGYVDKVYMSEGAPGTRIVKVRVRDNRMPLSGDKFASRCGQKGTIGLLVKEEDMPFTAEGIRPDIIINPHALPSRMTIGQLMESLIGKAACLEGRFGNSTAFENDALSHMQYFGELLTRNNFHSQGIEVMYDGLTGAQIEADIFIGPTYYMRLKHMTKDKINYRIKGPREALTRQPVQGKAHGGGLRFGEMERDCVIAHGINYFMKESLMVRGDEFYMAVCNKSGAVAIYNESKNVFLSPFADGPIAFEGRIKSESLQVVNISKFGRSFSIVRVPYAFKLLLQELQTMNVQMRLITEENIEQLTSLENSKAKLVLKERADLAEMSKEADGFKFAFEPTDNQRDEEENVETNTPLPVSDRFTKLPVPPFFKFLIPRTEINTADLNKLSSSRGDPNSEQWLPLKEALDEKKNEIGVIPKETYRKLADQLDMFMSLKQQIKYKSIMPNATNASLKMYEMLHQLQLVKDPLEESNCLPVVNAFCNAELPGAFIIAINHYMKSFCKESTFQWRASSFLDTAEGSTILDDKYKIYAKNRTNWFMGPKPNGLPQILADKFAEQGGLSGDVTKREVIKALSIAAHEVFAETGGATLYTSDIGREIVASEDYNDQETLLSDLNYGQTISGLLALAPGANFVTKQFTFFTPFSRSLIAVVASLFEETYIVKPQTSRPVNSEVYIVGKGFLGIDAELARALVKRYAKQLGKPAEFGSLLKEEKLLEVDTALLACAQEITEQQITFIDELLLLHSTKISYLDEKQITDKKIKAMQAWQKANPISFIDAQDQILMENSKPVNTSPEPSRKKTKVAAQIIQEPSAQQPSAQQQPSAPLGVQRQPSAPLGVQRQPSAPLGVQRQPSAPIGAQQQPSAPLGVQQQSVQTLKKQKLVKGGGALIPNIFTVPAEEAVPITVEETNVHLITL